MGVSSSRDGAIGTKVSGQPVTWEGRSMHQKTTCGFWHITPPKWPHSKNSGSIVLLFQASSFEGYPFCLVEVKIKVNILKVEVGSNPSGHSLSQLLKKTSWWLKRTPMASSVTSHKNDKWQKIMTEAIQSRFYVTGVRLYHLGCKGSNLSISHILIMGRSRDCPDPDDLHEKS